MAIDKGFGFFDKDKSGFVEGAEATEAAQKVLNLAGGAGKVSVFQLALADRLGCAGTVLALAGRLHLMVVALIGSAMCVVAIYAHATGTKAEQGGMSGCVGEN